MNKIIFHSNREYNSYIDKFYPEPTSKSIPKWYQETEKYEKTTNDTSACFIDSTFFVR